MAEIFSTTHPDFPLRFFADGNLGVVDPTLAKSYLCVVYRYLTKNPLDAREQESIVSLWHDRLSRQQLLVSDPNYDFVDKYLKLRAKVMGYNAKSYAQFYQAATQSQRDQEIGEDSYKLAESILADRIKRFGLKSAEVRSWIEGQDYVFNIKVPYTSYGTPPLLDASNELLIRQDRQYQIAAATYYLQKYADAAKLFAEISLDPLSPWKDWSSYLTMRCAYQIAMRSDDPKIVEQTADSIEKSMKGLAKDSIQYRRLYALFTPLLYQQLSPEESLERAVKRVLKSHSESLGEDIGDLTFLVDTWPSAQDSTENSQGTTGKDETPAPAPKLDTSKYDILDWIETFRKSSDLYLYDDKEIAAAKAKRVETGKHALSVWRTKHTLPWLVAAMSCVGLRSDKELFGAALLIPKNSPAYLTARFYIIDAMIARGNKYQANKEIAQILSRKDLSSTTRNIFSAQLLAVTTSLEQYLHASMMHAPDSLTGYEIIAGDWKNQEAKRTYSSEDVVFDDAVATDFDRNLPLAIWLKLCRDTSIDPALRKRIVRSTWVRAQLLERPEVAEQLSDQLGASFPEIAKRLAEYTGAKSIAAKHFALAKLILHNFGMTPYIDAGVERHGMTVGTFDYFNANFWTPLTVAVPAKSASDDSYLYGSVVPSGDDPLLTRVRANYQPGLRRLLSSEQIKQAREERELISKNAPSKFLGEYVISWAKAHPSDSSVPEMLYRVVRLPKWSASTPIGSAYSRKAYILLHKKYPGDSWAEQATCWY